MEDPQGNEEGADVTESVTIGAVSFEDESFTAAVEALLFAAGEPLVADHIAALLKVDGAKVEVALEQIRLRHEEAVSGFRLFAVAGKFQLRTRAEFAECIRALRAGRPRKLSGPALETLAVIAYRQPVVKSDIEKIRGVDVAPTLKTLLERDLVKIVGHQATPGTPALYGTTEEFLKLFGLNSLGELPTLRDIKEFEGEPGEQRSESNEESSELSETTAMHAS